MKDKNKTGCYGCKGLTYYDPEEFGSGGGWGCEKRDDLEEKYKTDMFPLKRKCKLFEV